MPQIAKIAIQVWVDPSITVTVVQSRKQPLKKLADTICSRINREEGSTALYMNDEFISEEETPDSLKLKDMDLIYIHRLPTERED